MPHGRLGKRRRSSPRAPTKTPTILVGLKENKWFYFHIEIRKYVANATLKIVFVTKNLKGVKLIRKLTMIFLLLFLLREFPRYFERNFPRLLILLTPTRSSNIWPLKWLSLLHPHPKMSSYTSRNTNLAGMANNTTSLCLKNIDKVSTLKK